MADRLFDDYFSVRLGCDVHLDWLSSTAAVPDTQQLADSLPPLRKQLDLLAEQEQLLLTELKDERQSPLARLLLLHQQKLELLSEALLSQDLQDKHWRRTVHFSAGGFSIPHSDIEGQTAKVTLRLPLGQVTGYATLVSQDDEYAYFQYVSLLDSDREKLVRLALQTQSDQLRARRERNEEK